MSSRRPYPEKKSRDAVPGAADRQPPQKSDAEQGVLASILREGEDGKADLLAQCRRMHLAPEDFFNTAHQIIFSAMLELDEACAGVSDITLPERLARMDQLTTVGGTPYINELRRRIEVASHAWHWLALVLEKSKRRRLITISGEIMERAFDPVALVADSAATSIADLVKLERGAEGDEETVVSVVKQTREMWRRALAGEPSPNRKTISFALPELDEKFEPLCWEDGDELVILCARSGVGKTSLARQIAKQHLFVTDLTAIGQVFLLESKARQLVARMAGLSSEIPYREGLDAAKLKRWRASEKRLRRYKTGATYGTMYAGEDLAHFQSRCEQEEFNSQAEVHSAWLDKIEEAADKRLFVRAHTFDADKI